MKKISITLDFLRKKSPSWEVDFRDSTIVANNQMSMIRFYAFIVTSVITVFLLCISVFVMFSHKSKQSTLNELSNKLAKDTIVQQKMSQENKKFIEVRTGVDTLWDNFKVPIDLCLCLDELCRSKPHEIKFSTLTLNCPTKQGEKTSSNVFDLQILGSVQGDVDILEKYKSQLLQLEAIKDIKDACKCFYNLERQQDETIPFKLVLQYEH